MPKRSINPFTDINQRRKVTGTEKFLSSDEFTSLSADEFQLNSKCAYIHKCNHRCINMYECTCAVIREKKTISKTYMRVFTTFITLNLKYTFNFPG